MVLLLTLLLAPRIALAQELLAPTPDANGTDPYVVDKAAELGNDPAAIFAFVRDEIGYHAYRGSLRGARGTLWSGAGNALDQANLLVALLRASGVPARYAHGTLPVDRAQELVLGMFPEPKQVFGCLDPQTETADPANDPDLIATAREHFWVQLDPGGGFQDADPTIAGAQLGQTFTAVADTFAQVPDELRHMVSVRLKREITTPAVSLFTGGGDGRDVAAVLEVQFGAAEAVGKSVSIGHYVQTGGIGAVIPTITNRYSPYFAFNERDGDLETSVIQRGQDYQEILTTFPFGSQILTGVLLEIELLIPEGGGSQRFELIEKTLVDRIGFVTRQIGIGDVDLQASTDTPSALSELDVVSLEISGSTQRREPLEVQEAALEVLAADMAVLELSVTPDAPVTVIEQSLRLLRRFGFELTSVIGGSLLRKSDLLADHLSRAFMTPWYLASPRIVAVRQLATVDAGGVAETTQEIDILRNTPAAVAAPGQAALAPWVLRYLRGFDDSYLEQDMFSDAAGNGGSGSLDLLLRALAVPGASLIAVAEQNVERLEPFALSAEAKARIVASALQGRVLFVPTHMAQVGGEPRVGWIEVDPDTGNAIAVADNGAHSGFPEKKAVDVTSTNLGNFVRSNSNPNNLKNFLGKTQQAAQQQNTRARLRSYTDAQKTAAGVVTTIGAAALNPVMGIEAISAFEELRPAAKLANDAAAAAEETIDPPVGGMLYAFPLSPEFGSLGGGGATGIDVGIIPHPLFTVPVGDALVPTVFKVGFKNLTATTDTFTIDLADIPPGFVPMQSVPSVVLGPGETGEIDVCLRPTSGVPPPGAPSSFSVEVSGAGASASASEDFTVPAVHALELSVTPPVLGTTPGVAVQATLTVRAIGNTSENVALAATLSPGLALSGLGPVSLAAGETATQALTLTPAAGTPLDTVLTAQITADSGGERPPTVLLPVRVLAPGATDAAAAAGAAAQLGRSDLAATLDALGTAISQLVQDSGDPAHKGQTLAALESLIAQAGDDPTLATVLAALEAARDALAAATTPAEIQAALGALQSALSPLATLLVELGTHAFTLALSPNTGVARPFSATQLQLVVRNTGTETSTYTFSVEGLPAGVTASFVPASLTLAPGEIAPTQADPGVRLSLTPGAAQSVAPLSFVVRATVQQAASVQRTASGALRVRDELVSVLDVTATPGFVAAGTPAQLATRLLNAVNQTRGARVSSVVKDAAQNVVATPPVKTVQLGVQSALVEVDLGTFATTGLANGQYVIEVAVAEQDGTPIPGATGTGTLLVGSPVTASMSIDPAVLPPGDGRVRSRLEIDTDLPFAEPFTLLGLVDTSAAGGIPNSLALAGSLAYVCSTEGVAIVDVSVPTAPAVVGTFAEDVINGVASTTCVVDGDRLYVVPTFSNGSSVYAFDITDPLSPVQVQFLSVPYNFVSDAFVLGDHLFASTNGVFFFLGGVNTIFRQFGDFLSVDVNDIVTPVSDVVFDTTGPTLGGLSNFWQVTRVSDDIAYVAGSTSEAGDTQIGNGRILVVDVSDPANLVVLKDLAIPGTVHTTGIAVQDGTALVAGSTGGWRNPFTPDFSDLEFLGTTTLTALDVSDPADPMIAGETLTTTFGPVSTSGQLHSAGNGVFAMSGFKVGDVQSVALIDASDPENLIVTTGAVPSEASSGLLNAKGFAIAGNHFYTSTSAGLGVFELASVAGIPVTASVRVPKNGGVAVVRDGFGSAPSETIAGPDFDTLVWRRAFAAGNTSDVITFSSDVVDLAAGELRDVTRGATVEFSIDGVSATIELPPLAVAGEQILALDPDTRTVAPGDVATYTLFVANPLAHDVTYALSVAGIPAEWVDLQPSVDVAAQSTAQVPLALRAAPLAVLGAHELVVTASSATGAEGSVVGTLVLDGAPVFADRRPRGAVLTIEPPSAAVGKGSSARFLVRLTNTGVATETFSFQFPAFPFGVDVELDAAEIVVPPGGDGFREFVLGLQPLAIASGTYPITLRAVGQGQDPTTAEATVELTVLEAGVDVEIDPVVGSPATTFTLTVKNTGTATETFALALSGALATSASLAAPSVTLGAGASQQVPITLGTIDFAFPGFVTLVATATAQGNPGVGDSVRAFVALDPSKDVVATFEPPTAELPAPGAAELLLSVHNAGNVDDEYSASIITTTGPVTAALRGLSGEATQSVPRFILPGLASAAIPVDATLTAGGSATITVRIQSRSDEGVFADAIAVVRTGAVVPTPTPGPTAEPTATPTPGPTPTPRPTGSPGALDSFKCYAVRSKSGTPRFPGIPGVRLGDEFESIVARLVREERLCNPAAVDAEPARDPATHLACYTLRPAPGEDLVVPEDMTIDNRFGEQLIRFRGNSNDRGICVPAEAHLETTTPSQTQPLDSFRCRRVRSFPRSSLRPMPEVMIEDEFESKRMRVRRIESLCVPVSRDGAEILDAESALACYQLSQSPRQAAFEAPGTVALSSDLGQQTITLRNGQRILCVPTRRR